MERHTVGVLGATGLVGLRLAPGATAVPKLTALTNGVERLDVVYDSVKPRSVRAFAGLR